MLIGICGTLCAGKTTVTRILEEEGFSSYSLSNALREVAASRDLPNKREILYSIGNEMRSKMGPGCLMEEALNHINPDEDWVVDSVRNIAEIRLLQNAGGFAIGLDGDVKLRYGRARARQEETGEDEKASNFGEFVEHEAKEESEDPYRPQLRKVVEASDAIIMNEGDRDMLRKDVLEAVESFKEKQLSGSR